MNFNNTIGNNRGIGKTYYKNPYEDAYLNRFGQWMLMKKRKYLTLATVYVNLTLALLPLAPHLPTTFLPLIISLCISGLYWLVRKIQFNTRHQKYIDFEHAKNYNGKK